MEFQATGPEATKLAAGQLKDQVRGLKRLSLGGGKRKDGGEIGRQEEGTRVSLRWRQSALRARSPWQTS